MAANKDINKSLKRMSKDQLIYQLNETQKDLGHQVGRALKYYQAYELVMEYLNRLHHDDRKEIHKKLKAMGL